MDRPIQLLIIYLLCAIGFFLFQIWLHRKFKSDIYFGVFGEPDGADLVCTSILWPIGITFASINSLFVLADRIMKAEND